MGHEQGDKAGGARPRHSIFSPAQLVVAIGCLWLLDGFLQLQPSQFRPGFALDLQMNAMAQPAVVADVTLRFGRLIEGHLVWWNAAFAASQLLFGTLILCRATRRVGLALSVLWALLVWVLGEGLGGVLTGFAMLPTGAPGAALLYGLLGLALWRYGRRLEVSGPSTAGARLRQDLLVIWRAVFTVGIILQIASPYASALRSRADLHELIDGEPRFLGAIDTALSVGLAHHAGLSTALLLLAETGLLLAPRWATNRLVLGVVLALFGAAWLLGENLGGLLSGSANDPGEMPLLMLLAVGVFIGTRGYAFAMEPMPTPRTVFERRPVTPLAP